MVRDTQFSLDTREDYLFLVLGAVALLLIVVFVTPVDSHARFALEDTEAYFIGETTGDALVFDQADVDLMNAASMFSLGSDPIGSERLYCGNVVDRKVTRFRLADRIVNSTLTRVAGGCVEPVEVFVHSQPFGSSQLSEEDRALESMVGYTCIQYGEIVRSPVSGEVGGVNCWDIQYGGSGPEFVPIPVGVR